ncbi:MAG TPA: hypothetical protein VHS07_02830, partial [Candidatus Binataceae bacterium]|nr:hypothetical protein [Candidatus Binataceae bacterium]
MVAYLSTDCFDHLYRKIECTSADIAQLRKSVYGRGLSMPVGLQVLEELLLNRRASPQELVARVKLTLSLASIRRMVKPCDQLVADDIRSYAATGQPDRPLVSAQIQNAITQGIAELIESDGEEFSEDITEVLEHTRQSKETFLQTIEASRQQIVTFADTLPSGIPFTDFLERFATPMIERSASLAGVLDQCRERGLDTLLQIKSVRASVAVMLSVIYGEIFEGWPPTSDARASFLHVPAAAAIADVFVTDEFRLRAAVERVAL